MSRIHLTVATCILLGGLSGCARPSEDTTAPAAPSDAVEAPSEEITAFDTTATSAGESGASTTIDSKEENGMSQESNYFEISTRLGRMVIRLYDETPIHRDNFRKLVAEGYYDGTTFHRVIEGFMIQGGDVLSKDDDPLNDGAGGPGYTLEAEFRKDLFHKRGAVAAARQGDSVNPDRRSSGSQFYVVQGTVLTAEQLDALASQMAARVPGFTFTDAARAAYTSEGGTPFLDGQYTVFGELVEGLDVLNAIAAANTPNRQGQRVNPALGDQPTEAIPMKVRPLVDYPS